MTQLSALAELLGVSADACGVWGVLHCAWEQVCAGDPELEEILRTHWTEENRIAQAAIWETVWERVATLPTAQRLAVWLPWPTDGSWWNGLPAMSRMGPS